MASKNLLPVVALCGALATGMPVAAWATPVMADSLPVALSPAPDPSSTIMCKRFSLKQATILTSGCLRRNTDASIVVDIERSNKENESQAGCAVCTWHSVVLDADDDPCDLELRIDIASIDDSANGAKVAFDSTFFEKGGGICLGCAAANADDAQPTLSFTASLRLTKAGTDAIAAGEASLLFYAVSTEDTDIHFEKSAGALSLTRGTKAGPIEIDAHALGRQCILADPALLEMEWNGSGAVGIVPSALGAKTLPSNEGPSNAAIKEEGADKEAGAGDTLALTNSVPASFETPDETVANPNDSELADSLGLADPQEIDEGNCCVLAALDHTEIIDAANIEVAAANQPVRKSAIIAFPESVEVVFLPSGEVVAPTLLTLLGAKNTRNEIKKITVVDPATTAKLRLYAVAPDGSKTLEFDGDTLLAWRRLDIMQDVSYQIELEGFDRARDANIIAAAIESPQRLMTLRFDYYPYVPTTT
ncbi:hypothetical protein [Collinsella aerofaciens]|uniref:hypothetical protein n=1 Tax=Collinsella aerofaciens TaxID=74426 RepID=UPI0034A5BA09